jgi:glutathione reductase (NADPH)
MEYDFDLVTLGAGSGGVAASRRAGSYGAKVAICESVRVGGTCVLRGCVPKKLLVYGSHFREELDDARGFGWTVGESTLDWGKLVAAKDRELDRLNAIYIRLLRDSKVKLLDGRGTIVDPHTVEVAGQRVTAKHILLATGGWPSLPRIPGIEHAITSNEALDLPKLPRRVVIVGGGYIAVEFAGIFHSAGAHVEIVLRGGAILRGFDEDIRSHLSGQMTKQGISIRCDTLVRSLEKEANGSISVRLSDNELLEADVVLYATGRAPNTKNLGLEAVGVKLTENGAVAVDEWSRTSVPSIHAIGDVTDRINLTPVAIHEGRAFAETTFNDRPMNVDYHGVPSAVFSQPPAATVGLSEEQARLAHASVDIYRSSFRPMKHTLSGRDAQTMMKLVVDRATDRVLGAHMVGVDAPEIIQGLAIALKCGATKAQFDSTIGIHPTAAEEFVTMRDPLPAPP